MESTGYQDAANQAADLGPFEKIVDGVVGKVMSQIDTRTVFGEPVREDRCTIIPVARMSYRFGFGGGSGAAQRANEPSSGGGGGGGGVLNARPVGYIETTPDGSRFVPVRDWSQILTAVVTIGAVLFVWGIKPGRNNQAG